MQLRTTLLFAAAAGVAVAGFFGFEHYAPTTAEAYAQASLLVRLKPATIDGLSITNNEEKIELHLENGVWRIREPARDLADPGIVLELLNTLAETTKNQRIDPHAAKSPSFKEMGLTKPDIRLQLHGAEAPPEIEFGKDTALEDQLYVRLAGDETAAVINRKLKEMLLRKPDDFRDRRLLALDPSYVRRLVVSTPAGEIDAEKKDDEWLLRKPLSTAADGRRVNELLSQIVTTRITEFVPTTDAAGSAALAEPRGKVTLYPGSSGAPIILSIGQAKDADATFAKLDSRAETTFTVPKTIEAFLSLRPADVRSHALLPLLFDEVDRMTISDAGGAKTVLGRQEESWQLKNSGNRPANGTAVRQLIEKLQSEQIVNFVDDAGADLAKYGLDLPQRTVVFSSYASANTPESGAGEHPLLTLLLGRTEGRLVYAKTDDAPFIFTVNARLLQDLPADAVQWQETALFRFTPEQIVTVEITPPGAEPILLQRDGGAWKSASGAANADAVESLVNTLATLRAVRWIGSGAPSGSFSSAVWQYTFTLSDGTKQQFTTGATTPEQMTYAMAKGGNGVFLISKPDIKVLQTLLLEHATSAPPGGLP